MVFISIIAAACAILGFLTVLALLTPSWHWVIAVIVVIGAGLAFLWVRHGIATTAPGYKEHIGDTLAIGVIGIWSFAFVFASIAYIAGLMWLHNRDQNK